VAVVLLSGACSPEQRSFAPGTGGASPAASSTTNGSSSSSSGGGAGGSGGGGADAGADSGTGGAGGSGTGGSGTGGMTPDGGSDAGNDAGKDAGNDGSALGGCHDALDQASLTQHQNLLLQDFETCAMQNPTNNLAFGACMTTKLAVTPGCGACYGTYRACGTLHCGPQCVNPSLACSACLANFCNAALTTCGGKVPNGL
jgi:hypothetical protein